ncbi:hypothetical protein SAMN04489740_3422 [Arthrobacter alpinus]|uniref:Uncharacterized protein n=1 Tax=Arthrobacter alpinus TaxID=656366 RepID=A0A1H5N6K1_9MICC|nr:hypothetical protein [Arthrobacter alpinus]SEE97090.1 hypothetical protein SAMN04489740_3422 [Arthrobacter alpinus]
MSEDLTRSTEFAGHNRISTQALTSLAKVAAADVLAVAPAQVRVTWHDDAGDLALSISSAMGAPSLTEVRRNPGRTAQSGGSILARATAAKARILDQLEYLSGSQVSRVDVRISGLITRSDGRVL